MFCYNKQDKRKTIFAGSILDLNKYVVEDERIMFQTFYPSACYDATYDIDFEAFYQKGYRAVIFDIDNTLVPHGAPADARSIALFQKLRTIGYQTMVLSNNKEPRVKSFAEQVGTNYIYKANKPSTKNYNKAMQDMGTNQQNTLFVGDQLFTDVWGAKRAGIYSILVKPIHPKEEIQIVIKRFFEKIVLFFYKRQCRKQAK